MVDPPFYDARAVYNVARERLFASKAGAFLFVYCFESIVEASLIARMLAPAGEQDLREVYWDSLMESDSPVYDGVIWVADGQPAKLIWLRPEEPALPKETMTILGFVERKEPGKRRRKTSG